MWITDWIQHLMTLAATATGGVAHWLGYCATCSCSSPGDCIDGSGIAAGSLAGLAAAAAARLFGNPNAGFIFAAGKRAMAPVRSAPSSNSPTVSQQPFGLRFVYRDKATDGQGKTWYHVDLPGGAAGWMSSDDTTNNRPTRPIPTEPIHLIDTGRAAQATGGITGTRG